MIAQALIWIAVIFAFSAVVAGLGDWLLNKELKKDEDADRQAARRALRKRTWVLIEELDDAA
jgi:hypothetical protein